MRTPGTLSSASGFSRIGFHRSVPGIRPYKRLRCCHAKKGSLSSYQNGHPRSRGTVHNHKQRYNHADYHANFNVPNNREEECQGHQCEIEPGFHSITHIMRYTMRNNGGYAKPKVIEYFVWSLSQKRNDDAGDTKMRH